ncbi:Adenylate cyclase [Diplonema papillatum]|nr:Adenylate cyclase [Diplonema papillatum]
MCVPKRETRLQRAFQSFMGLVLSPSDTATDRNRKKLMFPTAVFVFINQFGWSIFMLSSPLFFSMVITQLRTLQLAVFIAYMIWTKKLPQRVLEVLIITFAVSLCFLNDIATNGTREMWTCVIIVMDGLLLTECSDAAVKCMVALTILFLTVKTLEEGVSIGAYGLLPDSWTEVEIDSFDRGPGWTGAVLSIRLAVFLLDFALTRRFALGMLTQQQKANARAALAQEVAAALVRFDLDTAQKLVGNEADSLHEALRGLLNNLRLYRPYLPDALFNGKSADFPTDNSSFHYDDSFQTDMSSNSYDLQCAPRQTPPGAGSVADSDVTIVFTDVQSSTSIWEEHTAAMRDAMALHNSTIRDCVVRNNGYEVKTIGDAFMVSFDTALEGFDFSLCVQERFVSAPWPEDLLLHPLCQATQDADSRVYWRGLRVRIGLHTGPARLEFNPTTSRADYMGPTVNKAARVESASVGGAIAFTKEVFSAVELHMANVLRSPIVIDMGAIELKGVGAVQGVWAIFDGSIAKNWSARYKDAFYRGELAVVEEYAEDDPTLAKVLQLMRGECELPRPFRGGLVPPEKPAPEWLRESLVKPHRWLPQGAH